MGSIATVCDITKYEDELSRILDLANGNVTVSDDRPSGDQAIFALEKYLEDFLVSNWQVTPFGQTHNIYEVDGEQQGRQMQTDTGPLDILAESKDGKELLVIELKRGQAPSSVIGQILSYMAWVKESIAREDQSVRGIIIALDDDLRIRRALQMVNGVDFYRYEVKFSLNKVQAS
jgi:restriction system protein